jgi:nucleotide-binding universal stress UspA family protein
MYDTVLFPTDDSEGSERAAESAIETAVAHGAKLHVLHVVDEDVYNAYSGDEYVHDKEGLESALEQEGKEAVEAVADEARSAGAEVVTEVRRGAPHDVILSYIDEADADLVIMGTKERSGEYRQLLGSVTDRVLRTSSVPVTVVKTPVSE